MKHVCIVGYGAIGRVHAEALDELSEAAIYAICDTNRERADQGAGAYQCKVFYDFAECVCDTQIDSYHICTPHYLHFDMIDKCVQAGKMVVVEKPVTMKQEEFQILLSKYTDKPIYPVMQNRMNKCAKRLKAIVDTDESLGALRAVKGILTWHRTAEYYQSAAWRGTKAYEGGGVLINQAIHTLDLMVYLAGDIKSVSATASNKSLKGVIEVEDTMDARMEFDNGAIGIFYATNAYGSNSKPQIELEFDNATFRYMNGELYRNQELICHDDHQYRGKEYWGSGHGRLFHELYVNGNGYTIKDVQDTMEAMFSMYESADNNKEVQL